MEDLTKNKLWKFSGRLPQKDEEINEVLKLMSDKISKRTYQRKVNHTWRLFFEELNITSQCQLFVEMMRN